MTESLFRKEVLEQQQERLWGEVIITQPVSMKLVTAAVVMIVIMLIAYLTWGTYTRKERVQGYLVPQDGLVQVFADQPGTTAELLVEAGSVVSAGDTLARIQTDRNLANGSSVDASLIKIMKQQKTLLEQRIERAELKKDQREEHLGKSITNLEAQVQQLVRQKNLQEERLTLVRERYLALDNLRVEKLIAEDQYQERYQLYLDERQRMEQLSQTLIAKEADLEAANYELETLDTQIAEEIDLLSAEISLLDQQIIQSQGKRSFTIKAPISGQVTSLQIANGQRVVATRPLLAILPEDRVLEADLYVPTRAIGFVRPGLEVEIRYAPFPYERFGVYEAKVDHVAKTVLSPRDLDTPLRIEEPVYRIKASLSHTEVLAYGQRFPLQAGMQFDADILLDERPLYQWALKPLYSLTGAL